MEFLAKEAIMPKNVPSLLQAAVLASVAANHEIDTLTHVFPLTKIRLSILGQNFERKFLRCNQ